MVFFLCVPVLFSRTKILKSGDLHKLFFLSHFSSLKTFRYLCWKTGRLVQFNVGVYAVRSLTFTSALSQVQHAARRQSQVPRGRSQASVPRHGSHPELRHQPLVLVQMQPQIRHGFPGVGAQFQLNVYGFSSS